MKFARTLEEDQQPELYALYKQLKKSLRILDNPADAGSMVEPPHLPSSDSDEEMELPGSSSWPAPSPSVEQPPVAGGGNTSQAAAVAAAGSHGQSHAAALAGGAQSGQQAAGQQQGIEQQQLQQQQAQQQAGALLAPEGSNDASVLEGQADQQGPDPEQEARFVGLVEECVQQLNEDYLSKEEMLIIKADLAQTAATSAISRDELLSAYRSVVNVHGELVLLCHWSMMAYTGIVKILKKHYKRTGQRVQSALLANLLSQPFCSLEEVRELVKAAEQQIGALGGRLGLAPAMGPTAGTAAAAAVRDPADSQAHLGGLLRSASGTALAAAAGHQHQHQHQQHQHQQQRQRQHGEQQLGEQRQSGLQQQSEADAVQQGVEVEVVAASGRSLLKRDRSKSYTPAGPRFGKRQETLPSAEGGEGGAAPQSSGSSMQASQGGGTGGGAAGSAQQRSGGVNGSSGSGTPAGGSPMKGGSSGSGEGASGSGGSGRPTIMQRTKAALQLWKSLRSNAATPSTVVGQPKPPQQ